MAWLEKLNHPEYYVKTFLKWTILSLIVGVVGGLLGAAFHHALHFVTQVRTANPWLIWLRSSPAGCPLCWASTRKSIFWKRRRP